MHRDGRVDEVAAQRSEPRQRAVLIGAREAAEADNVRRQDRREFASFRHVPPHRPESPSGANRLPAAA